MDEVWSVVLETVETGTPGQIQDAIQMVNELEVNTRLQLFEAGFADVQRLYREADDGEVRQAAVRLVEALLPGLSTAIVLNNDSETGAISTAEVKDHLDTGVKFLQDALQDEDGYVRQAAQRGLEKCCQGYLSLGDTQAISGVASRLDLLAEEYDDDRREDIIEARNETEALLSDRGGELEGTISDLDNEPDL